MIKDYLNNRRILSKLKDKELNILTNSVFLKKILELERNFNTFFILTSCGYPSKYDTIVGIDYVEKFYNPEDISLKGRKNWLLGFITYEYGFQFYEDININKSFKFNFSPFCFFVPKHLLVKKQSNFYYITNDEKEFNSILQDLKRIKLFDQNYNAKIDFFLKSRTSKKDYYGNFDYILEKIRNGEVYEVNYTIEFFNESVEIEPSLVFYRFSEYNPNPFSCFVKHDNRYLICSSPERFLKKDKNKLLTQPIKGTILKDSNKNKPKISYKNKLENIMTVDLARCDLSGIALPNTLKVSKLLCLKELPTLFQVVSEICCEVSEDISFKEILKHTFPMASMTGIPKQSALYIINDVENYAREIYSGTVGYIDNNGNFDFNVVIRSLIYNKEICLLSYPVGGAITIYSNKEEEFNECLLKVKGLEKSLNTKIIWE